MITEEIGKIDSSPKELKKFGVTMFAAMLVLAGIFFLRGRDVHIYLAAAAVFFLIFGIAAPELLLPLHKAWMTFAVLMGWVMTRVILFVVFYFVVTPIGFVVRLLDRNFLSMKLESGKSSYWIEKSSLVKNTQSYERQF